MKMKRAFGLEENKPNSNPNKPNFKIPERIRSLSSSENAYPLTKKMAQHAKDLTSVVF